MRSMLQILNLAILTLLLLATVCLAQTQCAVLREIEQQPNPTYVVRCANGTSVIITASQYHTNKGKDGNFRQFCPDNLWLSASEEMRWQTDSELPEACDVFTLTPNLLVRNALLVYFNHSDGFYEEINTQEHALVYDGNTLVNFQPPVVGITIGQ